MTLDIFKPDDKNSNPPVADPKRKLTWQEIGLASFVFGVLGAVAVLVYDLYLRMTGQVMITDYCRAHPWAAWLILGLLQFLLTGLAIHFMAIVPVEK